MPFPVPVFEPHPLLTNGHLMTIAAALWRRTFSLPPSEERFFAVDGESKLLSHCNWQEGKRRDVPVIVLVHGLEGSSDSNYMKGVAEKACARGFHVVRLNQRNCGGTEMLTPTLYNSGMSEDYRAVFEELANVDGFEKIFFAGYSMGGNLVTKMAGEFGGSAPSQLRGVCAVCPAIDLAACADELERWDNYFYEGRFVRGLLKRYARKTKLFPQRYSKNGFGPIRTVREFDDAITAPQFGFKDAAEYYESAGAKKVVAQIRVPYLLITAQDDPFVPYGAIRAAGVETNPAIQFVVPRHGGHCGFVSRHGGPARFWAEERIVDFCCKQLKS
ncbi:MAG TPA: alpha/beta fold hydrolase [Candidatus Dormibacteraeota bacterium]|jgi:predicted alpha/beta-fold hydrolase|nr:alpha/beta fold hydrolase [Candidatus Dormibacteraeota bacterium]